MSPPIHNPEAGTALETPHGGVYVRRVDEPTEPPMTLNRDGLEGAPRSIKWLELCLGAAIPIATALIVIYATQQVFGQRMDRAETDIKQDAQERKEMREKIDNKLDTLTASVNVLSVEIAKLNRKP